MSHDLFPFPQPDLQVAFYYRLKSLRDIYLHEALSKTIQQIEIPHLDRELAKFVSSESLQKLAIFSLRGEAMFPVPILLKANPHLVGYYRLLYGYSQKEFYGKAKAGIFKLMEEKGKLTPITEVSLDKLCRSFSAVGHYFLNELDTVSLDGIEHLQLLTLGPQFRGGKNNEYGQLATAKTFVIIKEIVDPYITNSTETTIEIKNNSDRTVIIAFTSDPDISIVEQMPSQIRPLLAIEIKGGRDVSNIHNRIGEAEKSHQKARLANYREFITIISVQMAHDVLKKESPTTSHFLNLDNLIDKKSEDYIRFKEIIASTVGIAV